MKVNVLKELKSFNAKYAKKGWKFVFSDTLDPKVLRPITLVKFVHGHWVDSCTLTMSGALKEAEELKWKLK